ncbi:sulfite exporter TauE/SafE family protein, partial [bacterium]|nr:sulfite exporter TauE/SafE family protein [bacterium]
GGGSLAVPLMTLHKVNIHKAVATGAGFGLVIALPSSFGFLITHPPLAGLPPMTIGYINIPAFLIIISMTMITAPMGASLAHKLNVIVLKRTFAFFLISVAINMLYKSYFT